MLLFVPVPLIIWPVFVLVANLILGLGYGLIKPLVDTFCEPNGRLLTSGMASVFVGSWGHVEEFWEVESNGYMQYLETYCQYQASTIHTTVLIFDQFLFLLILVWEFYFPILVSLPFMCVCGVSYWGVLRGWNMREYFEMYWPV